MIGKHLSGSTRNSLNSRLKSTPSGVVAFERDPEHKEDDAEEVKGVALLNFEKRDEYRRSEDAALERHQNTIRSEAQRLFGRVPTRDEIWKD